MGPWRCSGSSNKELVDNMWRTKIIKDPRVRDAFLKVDRGKYAPKTRDGLTSMEAYQDSPQYIGHDATISAPHMHAYAMESLISNLVPTADNPSPRALDIGSGSGYLTHIMAELVGPSGMVVGVEHIRPLRDMAEQNMRTPRREEAVKKTPEGKKDGLEVVTVPDDGAELLDSGRVRFVVGDGRKGWVEPGDEEPGRELWDAIHVGAAAVEVHRALQDQLRVGGKLFIPVEGEGHWGGQGVLEITKVADEEFERKLVADVQYVPLTDAPKGSS